MRIADKMSFAQLNRNLFKNRQEMNRLQGEAASQKRVNKPSDDPVASHRILNARTELEGISQYMKNISTAKTFLEYSDQALGELTDVLIRAKELAIGQASDGGSNDESRKVAASETEQLGWQAMQIGNRKFGERYIFSGHKTDQAPFGQGGKYQGDSGDIKIQIDKASFLSMNLPGNKVFLGEGLSRDGIVKAEADTPTTPDELQQFKEKHKPLDETEKQSPEGEVRMRRTLASLLADKSEPAKAPEPAAPAGSNVFQVLKNFEISLMAGDRTGIQEAIDEIDAALNQVVNARAQVGARAQTLDRTFESMHKAKVDNQVTKSEMEDADLFNVISDINKTESALQATLQTSHKVIQPSLLDFLK